MSILNSASSHSFHRGGVGSSLKLLKSASAECTPRFSTWIFAALKKIPFLSKYLPLWHQGTNWNRNVFALLCGVKSALNKKANIARGEQITRVEEKNRREKKIIIQAKQQLITFSTGLLGLVFPCQPLRDGAELFELVQTDGESGVFWWNAVTSADSVGGSAVSRGKREKKHGPPKDARSETKRAAHQTTRIQELEMRRLPRLTSVSSIVIKNVSTTVAQLTICIINKGNTFLEMMEQLFCHDLNHFVWYAHRHNI